MAQDWTAELPEQQQVEGSVKLRAAPERAAARPVVGLSVASKAQRVRSVEQPVPVRAAEAAAQSRQLGEAQIQGRERREQRAQQSQQLWQQQLPPSLDPHPAST